MKHKTNGKKIRGAAADVLRAMAERKRKRSVKLKGKGKDVRAAKKMASARSLTSTASKIEAKGKKAPRTRRVGRPRA